MNEGLSEGTQAGISTRLDVRRGTVTVHKRGESGGVQNAGLFLLLALARKKNNKKKTMSEKEGEKKPAVRLQKQGRRRLQTAKQRRTHGWSSCASGLQDE